MLSPLCFGHTCFASKTLYRPSRTFALVFTFSLREKRKPGGDEENRTPDPLLARQVLSQLSYTPKFIRLAML